MKSIIEQASSIVKAIEKAWNQAEQPKEFSIKIFEKEERNFFGMTTKPAKIGIFFGDKSNNEKPIQKPRPEPKECRPSFGQTSARITSENAHKEQPFKTKNNSSDKPLEKQTESIKQKPVPSRKNDPQVIAQHNKQSLISQKQSKPVSAHASKEKKEEIATPGHNKSENKPVRIPAAWNEAMIASAHSWLKKTLDLMNITSVEFNSQIAGKNLKLIFNMPLAADIMQEKQLFRSFAHLIMSSLRNQYKQEIKDLRIILMRADAT